MAAPGEGARHPFCINGQAGGMRTVVGETGKNMHGYYVWLLSVISQNRLAGTHPSHSSCNVAWSIP